MVGILVELYMDFYIVVIGFLYDVVEDMDVILDDLKEEFGEDIVMLVDGVMKLGKIKYKFYEE